MKDLKTMCTTDDHCCARVSRPSTAFLAGVFLLAMAAAALAQPSPAQLADEALAEPPAAAQATPADGQLSIPLVELAIRGGWLMVPIALVSLVVVAIALERTMGLRRSRVLPRPLAAGLRDMADCNTFDLRAALRLCEQFPSSAARVAHAMLLKVGRPPSEVEHAITEACQREADHLYTNVRTLNLAVVVAPLLGLLGTVQGMIQAFFATANMPLGSDKSQVLAEGIYVALVTTFAGLTVAIPASVLAHMFETRILRLLRDVEQLLGTLLPQVERYEGKSSQAIRGGELRLDQRHLAAGAPNATLPVVHRETKAS
jgi:biopolymer transport protein ExbB